MSNDPKVTIIQPVSDATIAKADRDACFDYHVDAITHQVIEEFEWLGLPEGDQLSDLMVEINDALTAILQKWK